MPEDWLLDIRVSTSRLSRALLCRVFSHKMKPWKSPFGQPNVKMCERCKRFNPTEEWDHAEQEN